MKYGYCRELPHINEDNLTMYDLYQLLDKVNPTEKVIDVRMLSDCNHGYVSRNLNILIENERAFIDKIYFYDGLFFYVFIPDSGIKQYTLCSACMD